MALTKHQKTRIKRHVGDMSYIAAVITILSLVVIVANAQGF
ncbi:MAG: hypothetical protein ACEQSA_02475 [Weeksellaceae bacterium]